MMCSHEVKSSEIISSGNQLEETGRYCQLLYRADEQRWECSIYNSTGMIRIWAFGKGKTISEATDEALSEFRHKADRGELYD